MPRNLPVKEVYNRTQSQMIESFGVLMTERVLKILKHFYRVPMIQITMYIIKILQSEGVNALDYNKIAKIVTSRGLFREETDHVLARMIFGKGIPIPSYCFGYCKDECETCGGALCLQKTRSKKQSVKNDENNVQFGTSVMAITREGSFLGKLFKNNVEGAQLFMDIPNFKWGRQFHIPGDIGIING